MLQVEPRALAIMHPPIQCMRSLRAPSLPVTTTQFMRREFQLRMLFQVPRSGNFVNRVARVSCVVAIAIGGASK